MNQIKLRLPTLFLSSLSACLDLLERICRLLITSQVGIAPYCSKVNGVMPPKTYGWNRLPPGKMAAKYGG